MTQRWWSRARNPDLEEEDVFAEPRRCESGGALVPPTRDLIRGCDGRYPVSPILPLDAESRLEGGDAAALSVSLSLFSIPFPLSLSSLFSLLRRPSSRIHGLPSVPPLLAPSPPPSLLRPSALRLLPPCPTSRPKGTFLRRSPSPLSFPLPLSLSSLSLFFFFFARPPLWRTSRPSILVAPPGVAGRYKQARAKHPP